MRTQKHISNIAYHRPEVFAEVVRGLRASDSIGPCFWIAHKAEKTDAKDHIHLLLLGGLRVYNTDGLSSLFGFDVFPDGHKESMPVFWEVTKHPWTWFLYGIHDPTFLRSGNYGEKVFYYTWEDLVCCDEDRPTLDALISDAKEHQEALGDKVVRLVRSMFYSGQSLAYVLASGSIPIGSIGNVIRLWEALEQVRATEQQHAAKQ